MASSRQAALGVLCALCVPGVAPGQTLTILGNAAPLRGWVSAYIARSEPAGYPIDQFNWTYSWSGGQNSWQDDDADGDDMIPIDSEFLEQRGEMALQIVSLNTAGPLVRAAVDQRGAFAGGPGKVMDRQKNPQAVIDQGPDVADRGGRPGCHQFVARSSQ